MGITPSTLSLSWMRRELTKDDKQILKDAVDRVVAKRDNRRVQEA